MITDELMAMIDRKVKSDKEEKIAEQKRIKRETEQCKQKIRILRPRIVDAIKVGNYALSNGINLMKSRFGGHEGYDTGLFFSNGWSHIVGFLNCSTHNSPHICEMGIIKGGACGCVDFHTDGDCIYGYSTDKEIRVEPLLNDMKRFIDRFDDFEKALFEYIKIICK